jgi:hypothetical protein
MTLARTFMINFNRVIGAIGSSGGSAGTAGEIGTQIWICAEPGAYRSGKAPGEIALRPL